MKPVDYDYDVFISYRTKLTPDREVAEALQELVESFPVPNSLKSNVVSRGRWRTRLKAFRDVYDLNANEDLNNSIKEKLRRSRFLIAVCTRNYPKSVHCAEEVRYYHEIAGSHRILTLLVEGEPEESLPQFLIEDITPSEKSTVQDEHPQFSLPLAADIRSENPPGPVKTLAGKNVPKQLQAKFKLLAPILGCKSPDDLIQRDRKRFRQQLAMNLLGILVVIVILLLPWLVSNFLTFQIELSDQASSQQRSELIISRRFNPFGFRMGTWIFEDELSGVNSLNAVRQRKVISRSLMPNWNNLIALTNESRRTIANLEWSNEWPLTSTDQLWICDKYVFQSLCRCEPRIIPLLESLLNDKDERLRVRAAHRLVELGNREPNVINILSSKLDDPDEADSAKALEGIRLARVSNDIIVSKLIRMLSSSDRGGFLPAPTRAARLVEVLGISRKDVINALVELLNEPRTDIQEEAIKALGSLSNLDSTVINSLLAIIKNGWYDSLRQLTVESLVRIGERDKTILPAVVLLLKEKDSRTRAYASSILLRLGIAESNAEKTLDALLSEAPVEIQLFAASTLVKCRRCSSKLVETLCLIAQKNDSEISIGAMRSICTVIQQTAESGINADHQKPGNWNDKCRTTLIFKLDSDQIAVRKVAAELLLELKEISPKLLSTFVGLLLQRSPFDSQLQHRRWRDEIGKRIQALAGIDHSAMQAVLQLLDNDNEDVQACAVGILARLGGADSQIVERATQMMKHPDSDMRIRGTSALTQVAIRAKLTNESKLTPARAVSLVEQLLLDLNNDVREAAAQNIGQLANHLGDWDDEVQLQNLQHHNSVVRERTGIILACRRGLNPSTLERVRAFQRDPRPWVRQAAFHAIFRIEKRMCEQADTMLKK